MKKLFTLVAAICCLSFAANAQRKVNLEATLTAPTAGTTITSGGPSFDIKAVVKNIGTVPLKSTDTIIFQYQWGPYVLTINSATIFYRTGKVLNQNDTIQINRTGLTLTYTTPNNVDSTFDMCIVVQPINRTADSVIDDITTNNRACKSTIRKANPGTSIGLVATSGENTIEMYPNPVTNTANFSMNLSANADVTVQVYDLTGRMVINENKGRLNAGNNTITVNTANLQTGLFLYRVSIGNDVKTGKMVISQQ